MFLVRRCCLRELLNVKLSWQTDYCTRKKSGLIQVVVGVRSRITTALMNDVCYFVCIGSVFLSLRNTTIGAFDIEIGGFCFTFQVQLYSYRLVMAIERQGWQVFYINISETMARALLWKVGCSICKFPREFIIYNVIRYMP